tara:strand:+ start:509 stop:1084 length:576 start_codon:yes stop_codon:yes gene_type:complete
MTDSVWHNLSRFDVSKEVETKDRFDYLSWAWAWAYVKEKYPAATFEKHIFRDNQDNPLPFMRDTKGHTYVAVTVTIQDIAHTEIHYVMDNKNKSIPHPDGFAVNKALQRCLVKAIAFHGLGLNLYAGEDLPMDLDEQDSAFIIEDFSKAQNVDQIDASWRKHSAAISTLGKVEKNKVTDEFKKAKNKLKAA